MPETKPRWEIILTRQAEKTLYRLPKNLLQRIDRAILALAANPRPPASQPLPSHDHLFRLAVKDWRIAYTIEEERLVVLILEIAPQQQPERYRLEEELSDETNPSEETKDPYPAKANMPEAFFKMIKAQFLDEQRLELLNVLNYTRQQKIRLLIVDNVPETRENLRKLLYLEPDMEVVGAATNGEEAVQMAVAQQPDIVLMDIILPGINGLTATEIISQQVPSAQVIMMSIQGDVETFRLAMAAGAREFLIKPFSSDELTTSIRRVYQSIALQKRQAAALHSSLRDAFKDLKERIQAKLQADLDSTIEFSRPDEARQIVQNTFERILAQENIILSRSERKRLFEDIVAEILGSTEPSERSGQEKIRLLILADNAETPENLRWLLLFEPDVEIVGISIRGEEGFQMAAERQPDIVLRAITVPGTTSQQLSTIESTMIYVQDGADYLGSPAAVEAKEFLEMPFSSAELMGSIRRVYQLGSTGPGKQAIEPQGEAEAGPGKSEIKATGLWFKFYKLGNNVEISLSVADLSRSVNFYKKLGFERVDGGQKPYPWAVVSDGRLHLGLHQRAFSSPSLSYFMLHGLSERMEHLPKLGIKLDNIQKLDPIQGMQHNKLLHGTKFITAEFMSPEGRRVLLANLTSEVETTPSGRKFFSKYEAFGELSLNTNDVKAALAYWEKLGFECLAEGSQPYPWVIISDGRIRLGLHQTSKLSQPTITYFAPDMPERLKRLRRRGIQFVAEHKNKKGRRVGAVIESPDGQRFFLFTGEVKF